MHYTVQTSVDIILERNFLAIYTKIVHNLNYFISLSVDFRN